MFSEAYIYIYVWTLYSSKFLVLLVVHSANIYKCSKHLKLVEWQRLHLMRQWICDPLHKRLALNGSLENVSYHSISYKIANSQVLIIKTSVTGPKTCIAGLRSVRGPKARLQYPQSQEVMWAYPKNGRLVIIRGDIKIHWPQPPYQHYPNDPIVKDSCPSRMLQKFGSEWLGILTPPLTRSPRPPIFLPPYYSVIKGRILYT